MKSAISMVIVLFAFFSSCTSQKKLTMKTPFVLGEATYQPWTGGMKASGKGVKLEILTSDIEENVVFEQIYFQGNISPLHSEGDKLTANMKIDSGKKPDMVMHSDSVQEVGNQPPPLKEGKVDFPFEINDDEAVISYTKKGKRKYAKVVGMKKLKPLIYPAAKPNE
jgi:hypothetical protein